MPKVTFLLNDGSSRTLEANVGENIMQLATNHDIPGIIGRCGGYCNCGTCHVYVSDGWAARLSEPSQDEDALLSESAADRLSHSRLSCQIKLTAALDGIVVTIPDRQEF